MQHLFWRVECKNHFQSYNTYSMHPSIFINKATGIARSIPAGQMRQQPQYPSTLISNDAGQHSHLFNTNKVHVLSHYTNLCTQCLEEFLEFVLFFFHSHLSHNKLIIGFDTNLSMILMSTYQLR